ncbi:MAG: C4-type zinc ribbon domain-containing protein [Aquificaceae bacterium]|nr:C4-type zinc ribbon domain-containing protein [Aquificaceae bacterium]
MAYIIFFVRSDKFHKMLRIQQVELEIQRTKDSIQRLQNQAEDILGNMGKIKERRESILKRIEEIKREMKNHRELIEECKRKTKIAEERLNSVRKVEEYKALLREKAKNEDCVIKLTRSLKNLEEELKSLEQEKDSKKVVKELQNLEEELQDIRYSQSRLQDRLAELENILKTLKESTEEDILREYQALKKKYGIPAILPVDSLGACTGCGTKLPSALYSRVIAGEVVACPSCGRLLYYEEVT